MKNINKFYKALYYLKTTLIYARRLKKIGARTIIFDPMQIDNPKAIEIGDNTFVAHQAWLMGNPDATVATLKIGNGVRIGHFSHIIGLKHLEIENDVLLADKVYISDCEHCYEDISMPILYQPTRIIKEITIGEGSWIGENVCICGANVGKHSVIGANSVVTKDIPDYSIAVGCPAKVIKQYDFSSNKWIRI